MQGRSLTYDEQKAADAAFAGKSFNPEWSADAKVVYDGIVDALSARRVDCELLGEQITRLLSQRVACAEHEAEIAHLREIVAKQNRRLRGKGAA